MALMDLAPYILGFIVFCIVTLVMFLKSKAHHLQVRVPKNGGGSFIENDYLCLERKEKKTKVSYWVSVPWQKKIKIVSPPNESVDIGKKGKKFAIVYRLGESGDEFVYNKDRGVDNDSLVLKEGKKLAQAYIPYSVTERETVINEFERANADAPKSFMKDNGMAIIAMSIMAIIIVTGFVFGSEYYKAMGDAAAKTDGLIKDLKELPGSFKQSAAEIRPPQQGGVVVQGSESPPKK